MSWKSASHHPAGKYEIWVTSDDGRTWKLHAVADFALRVSRTDTKGWEWEVRTPLTSFPVSFAADGRYGLSVLPARDEETIPPTPAPPAGLAPECYLEIDATPPILTLASEQPGTMVSGASPVPLSWKAEDPHLAVRPISLEISLDQGNTWSSVVDNLENTGYYLWHPPALSTENCLLRLAARDSFGHIAYAQTGKPFALRTLHPVTNLLAPNYSPTTNARIRYAATDPNHCGIARLTLWNNPRPGTWEKLAGIQDFAATSFLCTLPEGSHRLFLTAEDRVGNTSPAPGPDTQPQLELTVDTTPPLPIWTTDRIPSPTTTLLGGTSLLLAWSCRETNQVPQSTRLEFSRDGGKNWESVAAELPSQTSYPWKIPLLTTKQGKLRVVIKDAAGNLGTAELPISLTIDGNQTRVDLQRIRSGPQGQTILDYQIRNWGLSGVDRLGVYLSNDGGTHWELQASTRPPGGSLTLMLPSGTYGFYLTCHRTDGYETPPPGSNTPPAQTFTVKLPPATLKLLTLNGEEILPGGSTVSLTWETAGPINRRAPVTIEFSSDSGWTWKSLVEKPFPLPEYSWQVPVVTSLTCRLRLTATDLLGQKVIVVSSKDFVIDSTPTLARIEGPQYSAVSTVPLQWECSSPLSNLKLWITQDEGRSWSLFQEIALKSRSFTFQGTDGRYGLRLHATPASGEDETPPRPGSVPQYYLVIDTTPPQVEMTTDISGHIFLAGEAIPLQWRGTDANFLPSPVQISCTWDGGKTWYPVGSREQATGSFPWTLPPHHSQECHLRLTAEDSAGNTTTWTHPKPFAIDTIVPTAEILSTKINPERHLLISYRLVSQGFLPVKEVQLYYTTDQGVHWEYYGTDQVTGEPLLFQPPAPQQEYGFFLTPVRERGPRRNPINGVTAPMAVFRLNTNHTLRLTQAPSGLIGSGATITMAWQLSADVSNPRYTIAFSRDAGRTWEKLAVNQAFPDRKWTWQPKDLSTYHGRLMISYQDEFGATIFAESPDFILDRDPPRMAITGFERGPDSALFLLYTAEDLAGSGIDTENPFELWYTKAGGNWEKMSSFVHTASPGRITLKVSDGEYQFRLAGRDRAGNPGTSTPPFALGWDSTPPVVVTFSGPRTGEICYGGTTRPLAWIVQEKHLAPRGIHLDFSADDGATWEPLQETGVLEGSWPWPIPLLSTPKARLRLVASDQARQVSEFRSDPFPVESSRPQVELTRASADASNRLVLEWRLTDPGVTPVELVTLWITKDGGKNWEKCQEIPLSATPGATAAGTIPAPLLLSLPKGRYGFFLTCARLAQNYRQAPPTPGQAPTQELEIVPVSLHGAFLAPLPGAQFPGSSRVEIAWAWDVPPSDTALPLTLTLSFSPDRGTNWETLATGETLNIGHFTWTTPQRDTRQGKLRLEAKDNQGTVSSIETTSDLVIDSLPPQVVLRAPPLLGTRRWLVVYDNPGRETLDQLFLWDSPDQGKTWAKIGSAPISVPLYFEGKEGPHGLYLTAIDRAGNQTPPPRPGTAPQAKMVVDTTPPALKLSTFTSPQIFFQGRQNLEIIAWTSSDEFPGRQAVTVEFSPDGGRHWEVIGIKQPAAGNMPWLLPDRPGRRLLLRLTCRDAAGNLARIHSSPFALYTPPTRLTIDKLSGRPDGTLDLSLRLPAALRSHLEGIELWITTNDGKQWSRSRRYPASTSPLNFDGSEGLYGFAVLPIFPGVPLHLPDHGELPAAAYLLTRTPAEITLATTHWRWPAAGPARLQWKADHIRPDRALLEILLRASPGDSWIPAGRRLARRGRAALPWRKNFPSSGEVRLVLDTGYGQKLERLATYQVVSDLPSLQAPIQVASGTLTVPIPFTTTGDRRLRRLLIYRSDNNGRQWRTWNTLLAPSSPLSLTFPTPGKACLFFAPFDEIGNHPSPPSPGTPPHTTVVIDLQPPVLTLSSPRRREFYEGGQELDVRWTCTDNDLPPRPIGIAISNNQGKTWTTLAGPLENTGRSRVTLPAIPGSYLLAVKATDLVGHVTEAVTPEPLSIDQLPPSLRITKVALQEPRTLILEIDLEQISRREVAEGMLWTSRNNGLTWVKSQTFSPLPVRLNFSGPAGIYSFIATLRTTDGYEEPDPRPRDRPEAQFSLFPPTPHLALTGPPPATFLAGGVPVSFTWTFTNILPEEITDYQIQLSFRPAEQTGWQPMADPLPLDTGSFTWTTPRQDLDRVQVRASLFRKSAAPNINATATLRGEFSVDQTPPIFAITIPPRPKKLLRGNRLTFSYRAEDLHPGASGIAEVRLYFRNLLEPDSPWKKITDLRSGDDLVLPDGKIGFYGLAYDRTGHASGPEPAVDTPPMYDVVVDSKLFISTE